MSSLLVRLILENTDKKLIKVLDYGSGFEPKIIQIVQKQLISKGFKIKIDCYDLYNKKQLIELNNNSSISFHNIDKLDSNKIIYDFCIIADTLHHIGVDNEDYIKSIFVKIKSLSKFIIIKDHFEWNLFSRLCLKMMDFIGNYYNDVNIPNKYYTKIQCENFLQGLSLKIQDKITNERYHPKIFMFLSNPRFHFIYLIS